MSGRPLSEITAEAEKVLAGASDFCARSMEVASEADDTKKVSMDHPASGLSASGDVSELGYLNREHTEAEWLAAQEGVDALVRVVQAADALVPYLDVNEVVPERERAALLNALVEVGFGARARGSGE